MPVPNSISATQGELSGEQAFEDVAEGGNRPSAGEPLLALASSVWRQILAPEWYLSTYPDVAEAGLPAWEHFQMYGMAEGRNPHPLFHVADYRARHLQGSPEDPAEHYLWTGARLGLDPHPLFDTQWYVSQHPVLAQWGENPLLHFISRHGTDWKVFLPAIVEKIEAILHAPDSWPPDMEPQQEAGIVVSGCGRLFRPLYANLLNIRETGCDLPIEVWHLPGEFNVRQKAALHSLARLVETGDSPFSGLSGRHEVHGFKAWMLSQSRFGKTLMLDVNSFPLQDVRKIFHSEHPAILWCDGPWECAAARTGPLRDALGVPVRPTEFESGQLYVNKFDARIRTALRLAAALNSLGQRLYAYTYGDKETYALALDLLEVAFITAPAPERASHAASLRLNSGVLQPWLDDTPLFYHPLDDRDSWWHYRPEWIKLEQTAREMDEACQ
ncbi:MAG TPA: hypothetical protein VF585_01315 [Chthoniobacterales bacterium]|jgi:hypothetical protein